MRILIYGAGVLGSLYAARLTRAGHDVALLARGERLAALRRDGIVLADVTSGARTATPVGLVERLAPDDPYDLVIVLMRRQQVAGVLPPLAANRRSPSVLFMTNNAAGAGEYVAALGRERVLLGFPGAGGVRDGDALRVLVAPRSSQPTTIGELDGRVTPRLRSIAAALEGAGFPTAISGRMEAWLQTHATLVVPIAEAIYLAGGDVYRLARTRDAVVLLVRAIREGFDVLRARGISIEPARYERLLRLPEPLLVALLRRGLASERAAVALGGHANAARDEMSHLAAELSELARDTEVATPASHRLRGALDPAAPLLPDGSAELRLDWRGLAPAAAALLGADLGAHLAPQRRALGVAGGALVGAAAGAAAARAMGPPRFLPKAAAWRRALAPWIEPSALVRVLARSEERYAELLAAHEMPASAALRRHLVRNILPGLALYHTLRENLPEPQVGPAWDAAVQAGLAAARLPQATLRYVPRPFELLRRIVPRVMERDYPAEGWETTWEEASDERVAFAIRRCYYLDTLARAGAPELTPRFCALDDWLATALPPTIAWERSTTLGRGGSVCDFCWRQVTATAPQAGDSR